MIFLRNTLPSRVFLDLRDSAMERALLLLTKAGAYNLPFKIILLLSGSVPFILLFGTVYHHITDSASYLASLMKFYIIINRLPGMASAMNEKTLAAAILVNGVYFLGLFTFAVFLGVVTDEVKTTFKSFKNGLYPVRKTGHILILHWNDQVPLLLRAIAKGKLLQPHDAFFQAPIVVMSDKLIPDMELAVRGIDHEIHVRTGSTASEADLLRVSAEKAAVVLIMSPQVATRDTLDTAKAASSSYNAATPAVASAAVTSVLQQAQVASAAMAVTSLSTKRGAIPGQRLVLQNPAGIHAGSMEGSFLSSTANACAAPLRARGGSLQVVELTKDDFAHRLMTLTALQPGIAKIYDEILQPGGVSLFTQPVPVALVGCPYKQVRRSFIQAVVCGYIRDGAIELLPSEDVTEVLQQNDRLVLLSHTSATKQQVQLSATAPLVFEAAWTKLRHSSSTSTIAELVAEESDSQSVDNDSQTTQVNASSPFSSPIAQNVGHSAAMEPMNDELAVTARSLHLAFNAPPQKIIVISLSAQVLTDFCDDFRMFTPRGSSVDFLLPAVAATGTEAAASIRSPQKGNCTFSVTQHVQNPNPATVQALFVAGIKEADAVMVAGLESLPSAQADAFVMAALIQIQEAARLSGRSNRLHVVARTTQSQTSLAIDNFLATCTRHQVPPTSSQDLVNKQSHPLPPVLYHPDLLHPDLLICNILALSARDPHYLSIVQYLLQKSVGAEVYFRDPIVYNIAAGMPVTFAEIAESSRFYNETAIGYLSVSSGKAVLAPRPDHTVELRGGDKIIVFAQDFCITAKHLTSSSMLSSRSDREKRGRTRRGNLFN
ncbi:hypothetical protein CEUSTIGMA_g2434.t1 [Chlamydomonas eustigma]|uniref:CASTOR/POLLUX/SYM8 ion channel conserved domain-containing protein n=1 Tax=Chlamydomonas eustigma TaxID=1157962 RepID=A0A250WVY1_9CHLO|nr:hypothetical protein CEUSTIGMA_g2434.t1 [Chlamydomonas eustigma]|eukprot:GAX74988.1 hypothetical protein CEUSTIGMA_g2434.t1 [Chlamydomonas eustigma]